jgi:NAD(P)-dependent dehydrogenase (short-subunit alcohol dehydrogenase family)
MANHALIVGGTQGLGKHLAAALLARGDSVTITGRDKERTEAVAAGLGKGATGVALDLTDPHSIKSALSHLPKIRYVAIAAIDRDSNTVRDYDVARAIKLTTMKLVGYTAVLHALAPKLTSDASVILFGGLAKEKPYPGSTTVTAVNGAVTAMVRTLAIELAPARVNAIHPGIVGDSPAWKDKAEALANVKKRTLTGRLITMDDITGAALFLFDNPSMNGVNLDVDGGWLLG